MEDSKTALAIREVARACGTLAADCSDTAGLAAQVAARIHAQQSMLTRLGALTRALTDQQALVSAATDEAHMLSEQSSAAIAEARAIILESITELADLATQVAGLRDHVDRFRAASAEAGQTTAAIANLASQSRILALNAAIEAARGGGASRAFAAVADEMGRLAQATQDATRRIADSMDELGTHSGSLIAVVEDNARRAGTVSGRFDAITRSLDTMGALVAQVDSQTGNIAHSSAAAFSNVSDMQSAFDVFADDAGSNSALLDTIYRRLEGLESEANVMLDRLASSGIGIDDTPFIEKAQAVAREIAAACDADIAAGAITADDIFDSDYRPVPGSDPEQFTTRFCAFADAHIRPILDRVTGEDRRMIGCVITDRNGWLPTHLSLRSQPQRGDRTWNDTWSRNRRFLLDPATTRALASDAEAMLTCYRMPLGGGQYLPIKSAFVPLVIAGRRWGVYEFSYVDSWSETAQSITAEGLEQSLARAA